MPPLYGTLSVIDSLAAYNATNVLEFGEDRMADYVRIILAANEAIVDEMVGDLVGYPPDRETTYGINTSTGEMVDLDEYGLADAQKIPFTPATVGFPLRKSGYTLQWTRDFLATTTPQELAYQVLGATAADQAHVQRSLRRAFFTSGNVTTYRDRLVDNKQYTIKRLANADGDAIPPHPVSGATFNGATHTHYLATASFVEANLVSLEETVREHMGAAGRMVVYINSAQEATVRAFSGFNAYIDPRIVYGTNANRTDQAVDILTTEDRAIGFHGPAEVWVKPWMPASYVLCFVAMGAGDPVLGWRRPTGAMAQFASLRLVAQLDRYPLHADAWERRYGVAVWNRVGAAVLYTGGGTYVDYTA
jgi:hypothetical protein